MKLTASQRAAAARAAQKLGIEVDWLLAVIQNESGGDPKIWTTATYKGKRGSAKGLIQFIDSTAQSLGYASSQDLVNRHPTFESQVEGPVVKFYQRMAPFASRDEFLASAFLPAYRKKLDVVMPAKERAWNNNKFRTLRDYAKYVWARYKGIKIVKEPFPVLLVAVGAGLWYWRKTWLK